MGGSLGGVSGRSSSNSSSGTPRTSTSSALGLAARGFAVGCAGRAVAGSFTKGPYVVICCSCAGGSSSTSDTVISIDLGTCRRKRSYRTTVPRGGSSTVSRFATRVRPKRAIGMYRTFALASRDSMAIRTRRTFSFSRSTGTERVLGMGWSSYRASVLG